MKHSGLLFLMVFTLASPGLLHAETPPVPVSKKETIGSYNEKIKQEENKKALLADQMKALEGQLSRTRGKLVDTAKAVQKNEKSLQGLESRIQENEAEQDRLDKILAEDRGQIAALVLALERIRRVPPEALLARPGAPLQTAQSAMLMGDIIPTLSRHAATLKENLETLNRVHGELKNDRRVALETADELHREQAKLDELVQKREVLYAQTQADYSERQKAAEKISAQAKNLKDLVDRLEADEKKKLEKVAAKAPPKVYIPKAGQPQLPIPGVILTRYDEPDEFGAPSKGVEIEGRTGALVVSPMGGVVRFAGPFKRYGNLIIIEHEKGYHSLIAGLEKIDTVVGHNVSAGEPLGQLSRSGGSKPSLYYELRLNGRPIDPSKKFAGLS